MNLFIDTNIFLGFFHLASDDLEELKKLAELIRRKKLRVLLPEQVEREFARNRENKVADAIKRFREIKLNMQFPQLAKDYSEYAELRRLMQSFDSLHRKLLDRITEDVANATLKADAIIETLFSLAQRQSTTDEIMRLALRRRDIGDPPGKNASLGDAINWETLLVAAPRGEDIHLVSGDGDFASELDGDKLKSVLDQEWREKKHSEAFFYRSLSQFFKRKFPQITLASEVATDLLIADLARSSSFATTHGIIAQLSREAEPSLSQTEVLLRIALNNSQVGWILTDNDVREYYRQLIDRCGKRLKRDLVEEVEKLLTPPEPSDDDGAESPF